jgi:hypothetical protein
MYIFILILGTHQRAVAVRACDLAEGWKQSRSLIMSSSKEARSMSRVKGCSDTAKVCVNG